MAFSGDSDSAHGRPEARNLLIFWSHTEDLMRHSMPTLANLAAALALALALLVGVLLPSDNAVHAAEPAFLVPGTDTREVPENTPPGVNIGDPVSATDADETGDDAIEFGNTLTYSLGGTDADKFDIDASTGQLITKAPLDAEVDGGSYSVTVTVDDGETRTAAAPCTTCEVTVTVTVTPVTEPPLAPHPPTVVSGPDTDGTPDNESTTSLRVVWHPPENAGRPAITGYAVVYKKSTETGFSATDATNVAQTGTTTNAIISALDADTSYDVRVRAINPDGDGLWSLVGTGSTNKEGNSAPSFNEDDSLVVRDVDENTPSGENVDGPVTATDADTTTLTYGFEGPHADLFSFDTRSGQIRTKAPLNHEDPGCYVENDPTDADDTDCIYRVTVTVVDRAGGSDATGVNIEVDDRAEPPSAPNRPIVRPTEKSSTSLDVRWDEPENSGPAITSYVVQYRKGSESFSDDGVVITGTTATISGIGDHDDDAGTDDAPWLSPNTSYEVRVRAINAERTTGGPWSATGTGRTNRSNRQPIFDARPGEGATSVRNSVFAVSLRVDENAREGHVVGRVFADDADNDKQVYKLVESADTPEARAHASKFTIDKNTGQIRTNASLNHESTDCGYVDTADPTTCTYTVEVEVRDERDEHGNVAEDEDADDSITVNIEVRDRDETPAMPTVMVTSPSKATSLEVFWHAENTGPAITEYDVQYRKGGGTFLNDNCGGTTADDNCSDIDATTLGTSLTTTIIELEENTTYSVQVRAKNAEGTSRWSSLITVKTNKDREDPAEPNAPPIIAGTTLTVAENTPSGRNVGATVSASEDDASTQLTYTLGGRHAGLFTIVSTSGQIRTRSALNHEDPACGYVATAVTTECEYTVRVKVDDRAGGSASVVVTITVEDVEEPPSRPSAPRVSATKDTGQSLDVTWSAPRDTGKPPINDYDIEYRKVGDEDNAWINWPHGTAADPTADNTDTSTKITRRAALATADPLEPSTQYEVRVKAKNGEDDSTTANWSSVGRGTTGKSNSRPSFDRTDSLITLRVDENTRAGQPIGSAVSASDADSNTLRYSLEGPGKDSFTIVSSSGQIRTRAALNHEEREFYSLTVKVDDGQRRKNSVAVKSVTVAVDDVEELPPPPAAPTVAGIPGSTSSVRVTWAEPANTGPPITGYDVHYREVRGGPDRWPHSGTDRSTIITGLKAGTRYEVQVRARSDEGTGEWSRWGSGMPNPDVANRPPTFSGGARSFSVAENTLPNTDVGTPIAATDRDGDVLTYTLEGTDRDSFDILSTSDGGQIRTSAELNFEEKASYAVTVRVTDGRGGTDAANVTIRVTDVDGEAPETPFAPTVTAISSTRLQVSWEAPANAGPPITDYDYRYREPAGSWTEVTNTTITETTETIEGLAASTSYDVEVRAKNAEGTSDWSNPGIGSTNAPGANNPPVFTEGQSATRTVSAAATAGTNIGDPVAATDADSGDTLTYILGGRDAANFDIDATNGQLRTKSGITLFVGTTYTVIVTADDQTDTARITVSIEATAAPPNIVPVFRDGTRTTRTVNASAPAGTSIGAPVSATDADTGDTITYSLEGTDAASFNIVAASGQIQTRSGVTLTQTTYTVTVKATDSKGGSATIAVTINVNLNAPPVFSEGASTTRSVVEPVARFTNIGNPVAATDADGDTLTYSIEGADRDSFFIDPSTGQLITRIELTVATKATYTVTVKATDSKGASATIAVTINVNAPPNVAPVFNEGSSATRSVREDASAGSSIGAPVTATDADNDTLTYSLEGTDAASFAIAASSGQLLTRSGVTLTANQAYTVTVVANDGRDSARITVTINVTVRRTYGCATSVAVSDESNTGLASDCEALLRARNQLAGNARLNWHEGTPMNLWQGVFLGGTPQRVTAVILRGGTAERPSRELGAQKLSGTIPADLGDLTMVTQINMHSNDLSGSIPSELNQLTRLQRLFLHNNRLSGTIPDLSSLSSLERLWLSGSNMNLSGGVPAWLNSMSKMEQLSLWGNNLSGSIPRLTGMTSLSLLKLQSNSLTGGVPAWFGDMNGPAILYLHDNDLSGNIPANLGRNTGVVRLWLDRNDLSGSIPSELGNMSSLRTLSLRDNQLSGNIPPELGNLSSLQVLRLHNNRRVDGETVLSTGLTGAIPSQFGNLSELTTLAASNNSLTGAIPSSLGNLGKLRVLWLSQNQLSGAIPSALGNLGDTLTHIRLSDNSFATNACVPRELANVANNDYSAAGLSICP